MWPYVTTGCLEAALSAEASNGTLPTPVKDQQMSSRTAPPLQKCVSVRLGSFKSTGTEDLGLPDSWRAQAEDSMCVRGCPSWGKSLAEPVGGSVVSLFSCARAQGVKSCRGSRAHTQLRPWALSHTHTMRLRRLGLGLGPRPLGSHTRNWYFIPRWDAFSVSSLELRVAGRSTELLEPHNQPKI